MCDGYTTVTSLRMKGVEEEEKEEGKEEVKIFITVETLWVIPCSCLNNNLFTCPCLHTCTYTNTHTPRQ